MKSGSVRIFFLGISAVALLSAGALPSRAAGEGATLFKTKCAVCHGPGGKSDTPTGKKLGARDLASSEVQSQTDAQLIETVTKGKGKMPAYGKSLKEDEIKDLVSYVRELAKTK